MAKVSNSTLKLVGIVLLVLGAGLLIWGFKESGSFGSQLTSVVSGSDDDVMMLYIGGAISIAVGAFLYIKK